MFYVLLVSLFSGGVTNLTGGLRVARQALLRHSATAADEVRSDFVVIISDGSVSDTDSVTSRIEADVLKLVTDIK